MPLEGTAGAMDSLTLDDHDITASWRAAARNDLAVVMTFALSDCYQQRGAFAGRRHSSNLNGELV